MLFEDGGTGWGQRVLRVFVPLPLSFDWEIFYSSRTMPDPNMHTFDMFEGFDKYIQ